MDAHKYIGISLVCPNGSSWDHNEDNAPPTAGSDTTYIQNVKTYVCSHTFNGVTPDCNRLYFSGGSSGGHEARAIMCSASTVGFFRATAIVSAGAQSSDGVNGSCFSTSDKTIFYQYMGGTSSSDPFNDFNQFLGFTKTVTWEASYGGCNSTPTNTNSTVNGHAITVADYTGCGYGSSADSFRQFQSVFCNNCGHSYPGLDGSTSQGWAADQSADFFDSTTN
jgi:poly(3-hydroxybutyrate) depolymerase